MRRAKMVWYVAVLAGAPCVVAQTSSTTGALQGSIKDTQGQVVPTAQIRYQRVVQTVRVGNQTLPAPGEAVVNNLVTADATGAFSLANLPSGQYVLCANVPGAPYLDPCIWHRPIPVTVSAAVTSVPSLTLEKGVFLKVRINDPQRLLPRTLDGPLTPRKLLVGVLYANGAYQGALNTGVDSAGRNYQLAIPAATAFKLWLFSRDVTLTDANGDSVTTNGPQNSFQAAVGQDQLFTFTVAGPSVQSK
jgi:hypothetical protein